MVCQIKNPIEENIRLIKVKLTGFWLEHRIPIAHSEHLIRRSIQETFQKLQQNVHMARQKQLVFNRFNKVSR